MFSLGLLGFDVGFVLYMGFGFFSFLFFCVFYVLYISFLWFKDVFFEEVRGQYSFFDCCMFFHGFRIFLFSELVLFFSIFWTYLDSSLCHLTWLGGDWCPVGILSPDYLGLNGMASFFLMINSQFLKYSRRFLCMNVYWCEIFLLFCIFVGGGFLCFQFYEYRNSCFIMGDSVYGGIFYIGTGLHGLHVFFGVCFLFVNFFRVKFFNFNWYHAQSYDMCIDYWRFLEWMWGFIFCLLYVWGS